MHGGCCGYGVGFDHCWGPKNHMVRQQRPQVYLFHFLLLLVSEWDMIITQNLRDYLDGR